MTKREWMAGLKDVIAGKARKSAMLQEANEGKVEGGGEESGSGHGASLVG